MSGEEHRTAAQLFESVNSRDCVMQNIGSSIATWARIIVSRIRLRPINVGQVITSPTLPSSVLGFVKISPALRSHGSPYKGTTHRKSIPQFLVSNGRSVCWPRHRTKSGYQEIKNHNNKTKARVFGQQQVSKRDQGP